MPELRAYPGGQTLPTPSAVDYTPGQLLGSVSGELGLRAFLEAAGHELVVTSDKEGPDSVFDRELPDADVTAAVLGLGYGVCLVAGLVEIEDLMHPRDLGSLTGIYYSLTDVGFVLPAILAATSHHSSYPLDLTIIATICAACTTTIAVARHRKQT